MKLNKPQKRDLMDRIGAHFTLTDLGVVVRATVIANFSKESS